MGVRTSCFFLEMSLEVSIIFGGPPGVGSSTEARRQFASRARGGGLEGKGWLLVGVDAVRAARQQRGGSAPPDRRPRPRRRGRPRLPAVRAVPAVCPPGPAGGRRGGAIHQRRHRPPPRPMVCAAAPSHTLLHATGGGKSVVFFVFLFGKICIFLCFF